MGREFPARIDAVFVGPTRSPRVARRFAMLVLSRKIDQEVVIDRRIRVRLLRLGRGRVRLGIEAPRGVDIRRAELGPATTCDSGEERMPKVGNGIT